MLALKILGSLWQIIPFWSKISKYAKTILVFDQILRSRPLIEWNMRHFSLWVFLNSIPFLKFSWALHFDVFQDPIYISQDQLDKFLQIQPISVNYSQWDSKMDSIIIQDVDTSKRIFKMDDDNAPSSVIYVIKKMSKHLCVILILLSLFGGFQLHFLVYPFL